MSVEIVDVRPATTEWIVSRSYQNSRLVTVKVVAYTDWGASIQAGEFLRKQFPGEDVWIVD